MRIRIILDNAFLAIVLTIACVALLFVTNRMAAPAERVLPLSGAGVPNYASLLTEINEETLRKDLQALTPAHGRFSGTPGCDQAAGYISKSLSDLGYQVFEQPFLVTVPVTHFARLRDSEGREIPDIKIHPLPPNWFRTVTTPLGGLTGIVYRGNLGLAREFKDVDLEGQFVLLPLGTPLDTVTSLGARAVFYCDNGRPDPGSAWGHHVDASLNLPRFLVTGNVKQLEGHRVTIEARVDFETRVARNIVGILDGGKPGRAALQISGDKNDHGFRPSNLTVGQGGSNLATNETTRKFSAHPSASEALIVNAYYDSYSYVPDLAPGAQQACGPAALLATGRSLAREAAKLKRSVIILATAGHGQGLFGVREFVSALGAGDSKGTVLPEARNRVAGLTRQVEIAGQSLAVAADDAWWAARGDEAEAAYWGSRPAEARTVFTQLVHRIMDEELMAAVEGVTQTRLEWVRQGMAVHDANGAQSKAFSAYNLARKGEQSVKTIQSAPPARIKQLWDEFLRAHRVRERVLAEARARLAAIAFEKERAEACLRLAEKLDPIQRVLFLSLDLTSETGRIGLVCGEPTMTSGCMPADTEIAVQFALAAGELDRFSQGGHEKTPAGQPRFVNLIRERNTKHLPFLPPKSGAPMYFESTAALCGGHTAFNLVTLDDNRIRMGCTGDTFEALRDEKPAREVELQEEKPLSKLVHTTRLAAATVSQMAMGHGRIIPVTRSSSLHTLRGDVVSQIGDDLTPTQIMPGAMVRFGPGLNQPPGMGGDLCLTADWQGRFSLENIWPHALSLEYLPSVNIDAAVVRPPDGEVTWTLSTSMSGPSMPYAVRNLPFAQFDRGSVSAVVFRAAPIQMVSMLDPTTFRPYARSSFLEQKTLAAPKEFKVESENSCEVYFVPPDTSLYITFKTGSKTNPNLVETCAFALGNTQEKKGGTKDGETVGGSEISGPGYLAADSPLITRIELDTALSMAGLNSRRVRLQQRYGMADEMLGAFSDKASRLAEDASRMAGEHRPVPSRLTALESVAYSSNIYPVIRRNASDAIWGILFYLFLAIPFAFFTEKLLVGEADIRRQIAWQAVIFCLFFLALRLLHPAYALVQSSILILLGFLTFALSALVSVFIVGKFSRNMSDMTRRFHQKIEVSDVSRAEATVTAFLLGLGNMRKRPVRTGLTMATLVLITFVMISFTSVRNDLTDVEFPLGKASYTGLLVRDRNLGDVSALGPLTELYGESHLVSPRAWAGNFTASFGQPPELAQYEITRSQGGKSLDTTANAIIGLSAAEADVTPIKSAFPVLNRWFTNNVEFACMLPRSLADELRLGNDEVAAGTPIVRLDGRPYSVLGIFDEARLETMTDLDGQSLLPIDILASQSPGQMSGGRGGAHDTAEIPESVPRLPARSVIITPIGAMPARDRTVSIAVAFRGLDYASARKLITSHLERSGEMTWFGLDGIAFYGGKLRMSSFHGLTDMVLPIILAALTVLNTMRGSVHERRNEIYVFNAVGLSPTHILWLFIAEALVYAVVGVVGGYLLAQGIGTGIHIFGLSAGIAMNYSSLSGVFVSITIMIVVLLSSYFPARMAAHLAAPSESMSRKRETVTGDVMELELPFTFNHRDRVAIIPYFLDWFENYGEGSSGEFYCSAPLCGVVKENQHGAAPFVRSTAWLKPYDLGVSQMVELVVRHNPQTGDNAGMVIMTRKSGDRDSWERCCYAFVGLVRKRFLTWRAVSAGDREMLLERARRLLDPEHQTAI